jgi:hypothetical protein
MNSQNKTFHFTVAQLIEILQSLPQDLPVLTSGYESGFENFYPPKIVALKHQPENKYYEGEFQETDEKDQDTFPAIILQRVWRDEP